MFDTHCHLFEDRFEEILDNTILESRNLGVSFFVVPGVTIDTSKRAIAISGMYENIYSAVGIHPSENLNLDDIEINERKITDLSLEKKVVAIGECGLDYYHFKNSPDIQKKYLEMQIKIAIKNDKSLILHSRQSTNDILSILSANWQNSLKGKVVFHCSSLEDEITEFASKNDCYLGIDGDITYDSYKQEKIKQISLDRIVLETDSPYLLPEPLKTKKLYPNTPGSLDITSRFIADLLNIDRSAVIAKTTVNAKRLFGIY